MVAITRIASVRSASRSFMSDSLEATHDDVRFAVDAPSGGLSAQDRVPRRLTIYARYAREVQSVSGWIADFNSSLSKQASPTPFEILNCWSPYVRGQISGQHGTRARTILIIQLPSGPYYRLGPPNNSDRSSPCRQHRLLDAKRSLQSGAAH